MKILILCETSGELRRRFYALGHSVISCDLLPCDDPAHPSAACHYQGDAADMLARDWDLILAHPPCTYLCSSGMHWTTRGLRDPQLTIDAIAFAESIWCHPSPRVMIENPVGALSTRSILGKPAQTIQPHQFGDDASKRTCLWLRGLPLLNPTRQIPPRMVDGKPRWTNQTDSGQNRVTPGPDRWKVRSATYPGIADAMASQWGSILFA
jgi:hypothetical protein